MEMSEKDKKAAKAFARLGGLKGGKARAEALDPIKVYSVPSPQANSTREGGTHAKR